jgi:hypothetical protein
VKVAVVGLPSTLAHDPRYTAHPLTTHQPLLTTHNTPLTSHYSPSATRPSQLSLAFGKKVKQQPLDVERARLVGKDVFDALARL